MILWLLMTLLDVPGANPVTATCASCHPVQAGEHAQSRHSMAWTNELFQHEYAPSPKAWCVGCHAPDVPAEARKAPALAVAEAGVSCVSCHVRDGKMVSSRRSPGSIHATEVDRDFGGDAMCASCHQFNFPVLGEGGALARYTTTPMQNTVAEYRRSGAKASCTGCHMSSGHQFLGSHDRKTLRRSLKVHTCRTSRSLRVGVENVGAAHNVPSGGVHRHIALRVWRSSTPARMRTLRLGRTFAIRAAGGKKLATDTTIAVGKTRRFSIPIASLGGPATEPINIRLDYVFQKPDAPEGTTPPEPALRFWEDRVVLSQVPRCGER